MLAEPDEPLSAFIQAIWSAQVHNDEPVRKPLFADAGSGIIFNLCGEVTIGEVSLPEGVIMLPSQHRAETITLTAGARLCGIRFHPAIGFGVLGRHYDQPTVLNRDEDQLYNLYGIYSELGDITETTGSVETLAAWTASSLDFTNVIPDDLEVALDSIRQGQALGRLDELTKTSQRHVERHFKRWLGMTPKHYQRVLRIKKAIYHLRHCKDASLADVAHQFGFSDQAHMTREFRAIARITPGQV